MRNDVAQALMLKVLEGASFEEIDEARKYFQNMASGNPSAPKKRL